MPGKDRSKAGRRGRCPSCHEVGRWLTVVLVLLATAPAAVAEETAEMVTLLRTFRSEFIAVTDLTNDSKVAPAAVPDTVVAMNKYETVQNLYEAVVGVNPSRWKGPRNSVEMVSWDDAVHFCDQATRLLREHELIDPDQFVRLPTRAEWEVFARSGTTTAYSFGDDPGQLGQYAWFSGNAAGNDPPVGAKKPNAWGLYDVHGYLWEWCAVGDARQNVASGPGNEDARFVRGGAWTAAAEDCRSDSVRRLARDATGPDIGFRCVLSRNAE